MASSKTANIIKNTLNINSLLCFLIFISLCFFPPIPLRSNFYIRVEDIILPFAFISILSNIKISKHWYFIMLFFWSIYAIVTMAINHRLNAYNDYTEIYKLFKLGVYIILFYLYFKEKKDYFIPVSIAFILIFIINIFHYYNIFDINNNLMRLYATNIYQLDTFGKNSLGFPDTKRILGTMGNPNINGIFISFFSIYFMSFLDKKKEIFANILFHLSIGLILLSQARTCFASLVIIYLIYFISKKPNLKQSLYIIASFIGVLFIVKIMDVYSLNYFTNAKLNIAQNGSLRGRLEAWKFLFDMIIEKPFFGYGINKNFFYDKNLYSENEYILMMWRYGIIGMLFYLTLIFGLVVYYRKKIFQNRNYLFIQYLQIVALFSINALTNNPVSEPVLLILFAIATGAFLSQHIINEKNKVHIC